MSSCNHVDHVAPAVPAPQPNNMLIPVAHMSGQYTIREDADITAVHGERMIRVPIKRDANGLVSMYLVYTSMGRKGYVEYDTTAPEAPRLVRSCISNRFIETKNTYFNIIALLLADVHCCGLAQLPPIIGDADGNMAMVISAIDTLITNVNQDNMALTANIGELNVTKHVVAQRDAAIAQRDAENARLVAENARLVAENNRLTAELAQNEQIFHNIGQYLQLPQPAVAPPYVPADIDIPRQVVDGVERAA